MGLGTKIIVVEDEVIIAASISQELRKAGYKVVAVVASAEQALAAIEKTRPEVVLMDIRIRGPIDGIETALQIPKGMKVAVIFMSAHGDPKTLDRAKAAGAAAYLRKPIAHPLLVSTIEAALAQGRSD